MAAEILSLQQLYQIHGGWEGPVGSAYQSHHPSQFASKKRQGWISVAVGSEMGREWAGDAPECRGRRQNRL